MSRPWEWSSPPLRAVLSQMEAQEVRVAGAGLSSTVLGGRDLAAALHLPDEGHTPPRRHTNQPTHREA